MPRSLMAILLLLLLLLPTTTSTVSAATTPAALFSRRINFGGDTWTDPEGHVWYSDDDKWSGKVLQGRCTNMAAFEYTVYEPLVCRYVRDPSV